MTDAGIPGTLPREHNKPQGRRPILVPISQTPGGGTHGSGSVCVSGAAALIYGGGLEGCASFDNYGLTLNGAIKQFGTGGAHLALGLSGQASTDSASQVNSGTSLYGQASLKAALGVGAEGAVGGEYSLDDGHVSGYGQGGGLLGVAGSVGEVGMEHGGNTGYLVRWPFVSGPSYVLVNDAILCQPWCARPPDPVY